MHAFVTEPQLFDGYLSMSPSMWWNNGLLLKRTEDFLRENPGLVKSLYITVANEGTGMGVEALAGLLKKSAPPGLSWTFDEYPQEVHGTITYKSTYNGLKFIFTDWNSGSLQFETGGDLVNASDSVTVKINTNGRRVHYTLDGSEPTNHSPVYDKPFVFTNPVVFKARPFFKAGQPGKVDSLTIK